MTERPKNLLRAFAHSVGCACARVTGHALHLTTRVRKRTLHWIDFSRALTGDDAYERYLAHWHTHHNGEGMPLDRKAFFKAEQERKWNGVRRCC